MSDWINRRFTIVLPGQTISITNVLKKEDPPPNSFDKEQESHSHGFLLGFGFKQFIHNRENVDNYLNSAITAYNVTRDLNIANIDGVNVASVYIGESESRFPVTRGVALYSANCAHISTWQLNLDTEKIPMIKKIFQKYGIDTVFRISPLPKENRRNCRTENNKAIGVFRYDDLSQSCTPVEKAQFQICDSSPGSTSPVFDSELYCPVFHNLSRTRSILEKSTVWMKEAEELLEICDATVSSDFNLEELKKKMKFPFVVVEGLDATGKTTLTETLEKKMSACRYFTPPPAIQHLREHFDNLPEIVRRAYYTIGNYIVSIAILKTCQERPVIMDRYWHSTAAYGIANETSNEDIPQEGHWVYKWPHDLLTPDIVLFLTVSEEIRKQRMMGRGGEKTMEEKHLDKDRLFRERLYLAYKRMENPSCIEIDASGSVETVMEAAERELAKQGVHLEQTVAN
ncbi:UMP-CMP kinase 2, mitochondrial-like [Saccostrea echinata]|uniref:UMP-CMP kinase 2, mitochondrial-like n=1 Tax=Saccostrea echinata TaxID=191078 RepID=UPI002A7ED851|nr:UMP-CMP kinase 2, mitochondrial-like [Saccostrea echinata]